MKKDKYTVGRIERLKKPCGKCITCKKKILDLS
jgi:hypothetical protein